MSLSAAIIDALIEAGATREQIAAAVKADIAEREAAEAARLNAKQAGNRERQRRWRERNADNALQDVTNVTARDTPAPSPEVSPQTPLPNPTHTPEDPTPRTRKAGNFPCPEGVNPDHWRDFLANRRTKRLTNSPTAHKQILRDLAKLSDDEWPPGRIVEFAAAAGWAGIHDPRSSYRTVSNGRSGTHPVGRHQPPDGRSATTRAAERVFGIPFGAGGP